MMKTLIKTLSVAMLFLATSTGTKAGTTELIKQATAHAVSRYIEIVVNGFVENVADLFSDQFSQSTNANGKVVTHTKSQVINFIKKHKNVKQACSTSYALIDQNNANSVAKVEMKYLEFTRVDYLMLSPEGKNWKVNQVITTFKDNK